MGCRPLWEPASGRDSATVPVQAAQSLVWGLGKVIALEHPELECTRIDLDPSAEGGSGAAEEIENLFAEIWLRDQEDQVAFRRGARHVARLVRYAQGEDASRALPQPSSSSDSSATMQLENSTPGALSGLSYRAAQRRSPGRGEVEIGVHASGLTFRDVLMALGMRPGDADLLGSECSGEVVAIGEGVVGFKVGDVVVGFAPGSFSTFVTTPVDMIVGKPEHLSFTEAATIPSAFVTAYYTLIELAKLSAGEKVLIHAAAGGVGLAAVQLAQRAGAEIFATAGSPEKREFLKALGVEHVMNSRTLDFAAEMMEITGGQGVDVVLNSLNGEFIPHSLSVLKDSGRFLEIGKRDIWDEQKVARFKRIGAYHIVDLVAVSRHNPALMKTILNQVMAGFQDNSLKPLPLRVFPCREVVHAFRHMQQAKHIGKIVIAPDEAGSILAADLRQPAVSNGRGTLKANFSPDASYLITGGLGGLGLLTAQWMVERGARHVVLMGRSGASEAARAAIGAMEEAGARVVVVQGDVAQKEDVAGVLMNIKGSMPPLRGIIHSAGVLDDGALPQQNWQRFTRVLAPKVDGAWLLHNLTRDLALDFFVLYSSMASLLGSRGQANHATANAFLDGLVHHRRLLGQAATSIQWGAWSEIGAAAARDVGERVTTLGVGTIAPENGLQVLERVLTRGVTEVGVFPVNWLKYLQQFGARTLPPFLSELALPAPDRIKSSSSAVQPPRMAQQLASAIPSERRNLLSDFVQAQALRVLGLEGSYTIDPEQPLRELGLDSLMAVELRNLLGSGLDLQRRLPATLLFDHPTINALVNYLANDVLEWKAVAEPNGEMSKADQKRATDLAELEALSEQDAEALLLKELKVKRPALANIKRCFIFIPLIHRPLI